MAAVDSPATLGAALRRFVKAPTALVLLTLCLAAAGIRLYLGAWGWHDLALALTVAAFWPLQEWLLHRAVLHQPPLRIGSRRWEPPHVRRHRLHHLEPWRLDLTVLPLYVHSLAPVVVVVAWAVLPPPLAATAVAVYFAMALQYEWIHFLVHTRYRPRGRVYRSLWRNHRLHHFKNEGYWFGFTVVTVDALFGTAPDPRDVPTSPTARTLGER
jgi:hypothetical protein